MRKFSVLCLIATLGLVFSARGDLTIVQKREEQGQQVEQTVKIKGDKEKIDTAANQPNIIDGKTGEMIALVNDQKRFVRLSAQQMKAGAQTITRFEVGEKPANPKLTPTGKKETINGYETEEYVYETTQFKASFWLATKYPGAANILKQMQAPLAGAWKPSNMGMPDYTDLPGVPIKTVISVGDKQAVTTIMSIKQDPISASEFEVPRDFQELKPPIGAAPPPTESVTPSSSATP